MGLREWLRGVVRKRKPMPSPPGMATPEPETPESTYPVVEPPG